MKTSRFNLSMLIDTKGGELIISDFACFGKVCCVGTFDGQVFGLTWNGEKFQVNFSTRVFKSESVRKLAFSASGKIILCGGSNGRFCMLKSETGKVKIRIDDIFGSSKEPIGAMLSLDDTDKLFAFGNDQGDVKILNMDSQASENPTVASFDEFDDQVTDMVYLAYRKVLVCSSGDGTFLVIDLKRNKVISHSKSDDDELTCVATAKNGNYILFGSGLGEVNIVKYNYWGEVADRLPAHPSTVNCLLAESDDSNILYTGCADGIVRKLRIQPHEIISEVVQLEDSVEKIALLNVEDGAQLLLAATCTDAVLNVVYLQEEEEEPVVMKTRGKRKLPSVDRDAAEKMAFFADL